MNNGRDLYGDTSSSQSAIIVPDPGNPMGYYVFTVDTSGADHDRDMGFNYSYVDMTMDNGLGAVVRKNVNLLTECSEKISAVVKDCDDNSYWVVTTSIQNIGSNNYNTFQCYEINPDGIQPPVTSVIPGLDISDYRGYLKLSPDGTRIASANALSGLYLFDFDPTTGLVSNPVSLFVDYDNLAPYGVEFSPNNRFLYVHSSNDDFDGPHSSSLLQYDLETPDISSSRRIIDYRPIYRGGLQLAPNGKIYRALSIDYDNGTQFLGVIENPNEPNAQYVHNAVDLGPGHFSSQGLPPFIQSFFEKVNIIGAAVAGRTSNGELPLCVGESFTLESPEFAGGIYVWYKDGVRLANSGRFLELVNVDPADSGEYRLEIEGLDLFRCPIRGEAKIVVEPIPDPQDTRLTQCDIDASPNDGRTFFDLNRALEGLTGSDYSFEMLFYETQEDFLNDIPIPNPKQYRNTFADQEIWVLVRNRGGCGNSARVILEAIPVSIGPSAVPVVRTCDEDADDGILAGILDLELLREVYTGYDVDFYPDLETMALSGATLQGEVEVAQGETLYVRLNDRGQCAAIEYVTVQIDPKPDLEPLVDIPVLCLNTPEITLTAVAGYDRYEWFWINESGYEEVVSEGRTTILVRPGNYRLEVTQITRGPEGIGSCSNSVTFNVPVSEPAQFDREPEVFDLSANNTVTVFASGAGDYEYALAAEGPYQDSSRFDTVPAGFLQVFVRDKNGCGIVSTNVSVVGHDKFFTPNNDGINDYWRIQGIDSQVQVGSVVLIFDRYGRLLAQVDPAGPGWDGRVNGNMVPASDYWFHVALQDGREFRGHFTLKR